VKEEVHVENSEEYPVMSRVFENVHKWHGVIAEAMNQYSLKLTFDIVQENHENTKLLIELIFKLLSVDSTLQRNHHINFPSSE